jgi:hypothetical protein
MNAQFCKDARLPHLDFNIHLLDRVYLTINHNRKYADLARQHQIMPSLNLLLV